MQLIQERRRSGCSERIIKAFRIVLLIVGGLTICFLIAVALRASFVADSLANRIFTQARPPTDSELPHTATAISYASDDIQVLGGQGHLLSCSVPKLVEKLIFPPRPGYAPTSLRMRQACVFHDYCYRHGAATYGYGQADCDYILMEQAYRICRFLNTRQTVGNCVSEARKVALGVRIGGSDSFKRADDTPQSPTEGSRNPCATDPKLSLLDDHCTSSYFEFDPYPIRATRYYAYRIADAPRSWSLGDQSKALYVFNTRPSGTEITIVGWGDDRTICAGYSLPGDVEYLNVPPRIVHSTVDGGAEDWFVWWRRRSLDQTGGKLSILAPGKATLDDWGKIFPGARRTTPTDCEVRQPKNDIVSSILVAQNYSLGEKNPDAEDGEFSDIFPAPGLANDKHLLWLTLRSHSCATRRTCYHEIRIDPSSADGKIKLEPYALHDNVKSPPSATRTDREPDRYRNYVTPPIAIAGPNGPGLAWLRRGEAQGETYDEAALLRRAYRTGTVGRNFGLVLLRDFPEESDPVFIAGRKSSRPRLYALMAGSDHSLTMKEWWLPPFITSDKAAPFEQNGICKGRVPTGTLINSAQASVCPRKVATGCTQTLDDTWLIRPPTVLSSNPEATEIVFNRFRAESESLGTLMPTIEIRVARIDQKGECTFGNAQTIDLGTRIATKPKSSGKTDEPTKGETEEAKRAKIASLRGRPLLVTQTSDGRSLLAIVPDPRQPSSSVRRILSR